MSRWGDWCGIQQIEDIGGDRLCRTVYQGCRRDKRGKVRGAITYRVLKVFDRVDAESLFLHVEESCTGGHSLTLRRCPFKKEAISNLFSQTLANLWNFYRRKL